MRLTDYIKDLGRVVAFYPGLNRITGSTNASILLSQLLYWTDKTNDGWLRRTSDMLQEETGLTYNEQRTARDILREKGIIIDVYRRLDHEIAFKVNQGVLNDLWEESGGETIKPIEKLEYKKQIKKQAVSLETFSDKAPISPEVLEEAFQKSPSVEEKSAEEKSVEEKNEETIGKLYPRKKDFIDIALGEDAKKTNAIYERKRYITERIESKLNLTDILSNAKWISFVDFAYNRFIKHNEDIDIFLNWTLHNEAYNPAYWTPGKMRTLWSQAFVSNQPDENFVKQKEFVETIPDDEVIPPPFDLSMKSNLYGE